jgi:hypothetical protein
VGEGSGLDPLDDGTVRKGNPYTRGVLDLIADLPLLIEVVLVLDKNVPGSGKVLRY